MKKSTPIFRRLFPIILTTIILVGCGGNQSDIEILQREAEYSGEEISVGTYDSKSIVFAYDNESGPTTELYVALDYGEESAQSRHDRKDVDIHCLFIIGNNEGSYQSATVYFTYQAKIDLKAGMASDINNETVLTGAIAAGDVSYVEAFLDAAAAGLKAFIDNRRAYEGITEKWLLDKLESLGLNINA